jgi:hypothetical protein
VGGPAPIAPHQQRQDADDRDSERRADPVAVGPPLAGDADDPQVRLADNGSRLFANETIRRRAVLCCWLI